jgi:hypothetical protein
LLCPGAMKILLRSILGLLAVHFAVLENQAWAGWSLVLSGRVSRVVSAGDNVAAVRGKTVFLLRDDGTSVGRLDPSETEWRQRSSRSDGRQEEDVLDFLGIDESEQDGAWVEDELNNESTLAQRRLRREGRRVRGLQATGSPEIAARAHDIWIANAGGLWYWSGSDSLLHVTSHALSGARLSALADGQVLVAVGTQIWMSSLGSESVHSQASIESIRHITASGSGRSVAWASENKIELRDSASDSGQTVQVPQGIRALHYCGEDLLLLSQDGLISLTPDGTPIPVSPRLTAHRFACTEAPAPWLATGPDLQMSSDQGRTWTSIVLPVSTRVFDAAVGKDAIWVATESGLYRVSDRPSSDDVTNTAFVPLQQPALGSRVSPWWAAWLPQITVAGGALLARGRRDIQTVALASFPLDAPTPHRAFRLVADNTEVPVAPEPRTIDITMTPDPDANCLPVTRAKAVSLAMVEPERGRSYVARARHAAWLPELRLRVDRRFGRSESLDVPSTSTSTTSPLGVDTVDDVRYEARVTWDLSRLVFSSDELAAQAQTMHMAEMRRDIEVTVGRLYFERRRLRLERLSTGTTERSIRRELRVREIESELDALSGGVFSQCTAGRTIEQGDS